MLDATFIYRPAKDVRELTEQGIAHFEVCPVKQSGAALGPAIDMTLTRAGNGLERGFFLIDRRQRAKRGRPPGKSSPELDAAILGYIRNAQERVIRATVGAEMSAKRMR